MRDEFEKIDWLKARFELDSDPEGVVLGIGDDAAIFDFGNRPTVVTVDTQVEGVHFRRDLISCRDVGRRAIVAAASDVWAMAAVPTACVVALTLPEGLTEQDFRELIEGLGGSARSTGARVIGGNLSRAPALSITTTVFGYPVGTPVRRDGARPGDALYVTGTLGAAALGLAILEAERADLEHSERFIGRWRRPPSNNRIARALGDFATAAIDVSDGCLQDLEHICAVSGVGATIHVDTLPFAAGYEQACSALGLDPVELALTGGEDYELLFTASPSSEAEALATKIGVITEELPVRAIDSEGRPVEPSRAGFRHFS